MKQLTAVSLFAGVGGFDLALERSGVKVVASVEIDPKALNVLANHFPNSKLFNDIKGVTGEQLINAGFDPENGIITGGFPCQDLSVAGKRAGLDGNRSGLFWEICRLLDETKARYFILENVPGLLSSNQGKDMATVVKALVELGYGIAWRVISTKAAQGILRRAENREKQLPKILVESLTRLAHSLPETTRD
jgi:DNA (cytosine-5)-methyltransferase 1